MNLRLAIYAALFLGLLALCAYAKYEHSRAERLDGEARTLKATILAERENTRKANEASTKYQADLARIGTERSNVPVVRLCHSTMPARPAATGPDAATEGHLSEAPAGNIEPGPDIGSALLEYGIACEANQLQLERLQEWVRKR